MRKELLKSMYIACISKYRHYVFVRSVLNLVREVTGDIRSPIQYRTFASFFLSRKHVIYYWFVKSNSNTEVNSERQRFVNNSLRAALRNSVCNSPAISEVLIQFVRPAFDSLCQLLMVSHVSRWKRNWNGACVFFSLLEIAKNRNKISYFRAEQKRIYTYIFVYSVSISR